MAQEGCGCGCEMGVTRGAQRDWAGEEKNTEANGSDGTVEQATARAVASHSAYDDVYECIRMRVEGGEVAGG